MLFIVLVTDLRHHDGGEELWYHPLCLRHLAADQAGLQQECRYALELFVIHMSLGLKEPTTPTRVKKDLEMPKKSSYCLQSTPMVRPYVIYNLCNAYMQSLAQLALLRACSKPFLYQTLVLFGSQHFNVR